MSESIWQFPDIGDGGGSTPPPPPPSTTPPTSGGYLETRITPDPIVGRWAQIQRPARYNVVPAERPISLSGLLRCVDWTKVVAFYGLASTGQVLDSSGAIIAANAIGILFDQSAARLAVVRAGSASLSAYLGELPGTDPASVGVRVSGNRRGVEVYAGTRIAQAYTDIGLPAPDAPMALTLAMVNRHASANALLLARPVAFQPIDEVIS